MTFSRARIIALLLLSQAACKGDSTGPRTTVSNVTVTNVSVTLASPTVVVGGTTTAVVVVRGSDGSTITNRAITWQSSSPARAAVVGSGLTATVSAVAQGEFNITATCDGVFGTAVVKIIPPPIALNNPTVSPATATLSGPGATQILSTAVESAPGAVILYANSSSNPAVATVTPTGAAPVVTAVGVGTATINIALSGTGPGLTPVTQTIAATIIVPPTASVTMALVNSALNAGQTTQATATPRDASGTTLTGRTITWGSSSSAVATVNQNTGLVTAVAPGVTTISATIEGRTASATLAVCQTGFAPPATGSNTIFVSAGSGDDAAGSGSCALPFRTITKGVSTAASGTNIRVAPGTYNATLGEQFPIMLPAGAALIGDESNHGQGTTRTKVFGGGLLPFSGQNCGQYSSTIYPGIGATIAGFELTNPNAVSGQMTLVLRTDNVVIRNNTVTGQLSGGAALYICNGAKNLVIAGNRILDNTAVGIGFIGGGAGTRVENNVITNNTYGIEYDNEGGDLGSGATGSVGGNAIFCNRLNDLWTNNGFAIFAANNFWDHVPVSGNDIFNGGGASIITTGAKLAAGNCS